MKTVLYKAGDDKSHMELGKMLRELKPGEYVVTVKQNRQIRSLSANKYYHAIINIIAIHTGHTHDQIHDICKHKFNGDVVHLPKGGMVIVAKTTSDLDTKEFASYINRVVQWAQEEFDIIIPSPADIDTKMWMDIQNNYERVFSGY